MRRRQHGLLARQDQRPFDHVLELADVARPGVFEENAERFGGKPVGGFREPTAEAIQERVREQRDIGLSFAQRGDDQRDHVEAVIEVLAESPRGDHLLEVAVGRGDDPDVHGDVFVSTHPLDDPLLEHPQELDLEGRRQFADFV